MRRLKLFVTKTEHEVKYWESGIINGEIIGFCVQSIIQAIPSTLLFIHAAECLRSIAKEKKDYIHICLFLVRSRTCTKCPCSLRILSCLYMYHKSMKWQHQVDVLPVALYRCTSVFIESLSKSHWRILQYAIL